MLRPRRLRLVAAALLALLLLGPGCAPKDLSSSDVDSAPRPALDTAEGLLRSGDTSAAEEKYAALLAAHPDSWEASRGLQDCRRRRLSAVEFEELYPAPKDRPDALAWYLRGRALIERPGEAMAAFEEAERLAPLSPWPPAGRAYLFGAAGNRYLSVKAYEEAVERMPRSALLRFLLGNELLRLKLLVDAQRHLEFGHRLAPDDPHMTAALGKVYVELGRHETGRGLLETALAEDPQQPDVALSLARLVLLDREVDRAEALYRQALEGGLPPDPEFYGEIRAARVAVTPAE